MMFFPSIMASIENGCLIILIMLMFVYILVGIPIFGRLLLFYLLISCYIVTLLLMISIATYWLLFYMLIMMWLLGLLFGQFYSFNIASPWCLLGDFNTVRSSTDMLVCDVTWNSGMNEFNAFLVDFGLDDLRLVDSKFTRTNCQDANPLYRKFDRVLVNSHYLTYSAVTFAPDVFLIIAPLFYNWSYLMLGTWKLLEYIIICLLWSSSHKFIPLRCPVLLRVTLFLNIKR